jgi:hypothetical protein
MEYIMIILFFAMWFASAISVISNIAPYANELETWKQIVVSAVVIVGAPFMLIVQAIELILDIFLEEGWNDDDDNKFGY